MTAIKQSAHNGNKAKSHEESLNGRFVNPRREATSQLRPLEIYPCSHVGHNLDGRSSYIVQQ